MTRPQTRYARSGDVSIAYQVLGQGPYDVVFVPPHVSNVELIWEIPPRAEGMLRLAESARVLTFDKRGTGLSDRVAGVASLEERMDDVRAVMDAEGSSKAALLGVLEGGPMSMLFAATYPTRCFALVLFNAYARTAWAPDYEWAATAQQLEQRARAVETDWGTPDSAARLVQELYPDLSGPERDERIETFARFHRQSASPGAAAAWERMNNEIDVRDVLPAIQAPTLVLLPSAASESQQRDARYLAGHIPNAEFVELEDRGFALFAGDLDRRLALIQDFLAEAAAQSAGPEPDRVLATVLFTDIVDSTAKAVALGDRAWRDLVHQHHNRVRRELTRFRGRELDTAGDGFFASFDGPARAIRCAAAIRASVAELGLEVRAGLHTGECELIDGKVAGVAVATGARIATLAGTGDILVSATVRDLVAGSGIQFTDRGFHQLKGLPEQRQIFALADA